MLSANIVQGARTGQQPELVRAPILQQKTCAWGGNYADSWAVSNYGVPSFKLYDIYSSRCSLRRSMALVMKPFSANWMAHSGPM